MASIMDKMWFKAFAILLLFFLIQVYIAFSNVQNFETDKMTLDAEIASLERKRDSIRMDVLTKEREITRLEKRVEQLEVLVRDRTSLIPPGRLSENAIYFITPTHFRPGQKADLTRLSQTLAHVPKLHWIVVEDAENPSEGVRRILKRSRVQFTHLSAATKSDMKMNYTQPNWSLPRGVNQRNAALNWIRTQLSTVKSGAVYFGDDDNTYDLRLFAEIRKVNKAGVWPVGIVGGLLVETPQLFPNGTVNGFNAVWKPERPFPIDMAAFAVNVTLLLNHPEAGFKFEVPRGYQMGERKGQNFYYPPDFNYKVHKSLNKYHGTHALRERAAKLGQGILIIRFEMPFNIWCLGCHNHVGMGVRYNAEKKRVGHYYTTPLYEFRMKCHLCDNYFVIRTDPKNFDYELVEGCSRQEKRYDPSTINQLGAVDRSFNQKLAADAMFKAEHEHEDKKVAESEESRVEKLEWLNERMRDDFTANQVLRAKFRKDRTELKEQRAKDDELRQRSSLSIKLLPDAPEDQKVASMLKRYSSVKTFDERQEESRDAVSTRRIFSSGPSTSSDPFSSVERLKRSLRQDRDRKINDKFQNNSVKFGMMSGIVRKKAKVESTSSSSSGTTPVVLEDEVEDVKPDIDQKPALAGLVADYGSSSPDSD